MRVRLSNIRLFAVLTVGVLVLGGCICHEKAVERRESVCGDITPEAASALIQKRGDDPDFLILDVRTPGEYGSGYIEDAVNLDCQAETFQDDLEGLDRRGTYLVYCLVGGRSGRVLRMMKDRGFEEAYNLLGGITRWRAEGLPVVGEKAVP